MLYIDEYKYKDFNKFNRAVEKMTGDTKSTVQVRYYPDLMLIYS